MGGKPRSLPNALPREVRLSRIRAAAVRLEMQPMVPRAGVAPGTTALQLPRLPQPRDERGRFAHWPKRGPRLSLSDWIKDKHWTTVDLDDLDGMGNRKEPV